MAGSTIKSRATNNFEELQALYNKLLHQVQNKKKKLEQLQARCADLSG
jgi:uncharacterized protein YoxC